MDQLVLKVGLGDVMDEVRNQQIPLHLVMAWFEEHLPFKDSFCRHLATFFTET